MTENVRPDAINWLTSVPDWCPAPGWTTVPGRLATASTWSSSYRMSSSLPVCGINPVRGGGVGMRTASVAPATTR